MQPRTRAYIALHSNASSHFLRKMNRGSLYESFHVRGAGFFIVAQKAKGIMTNSPYAEGKPSLLKSRWGNQGRTQSTLKEAGLFIRRFLKKGGSIPNLLLVYLL